MVSWIIILILSSLLGQIFVIPFQTIELEFLKKYPTEFLPYIVVYFGFELGRRTLIISFLSFVVGSTIMAYIIGDNGWKYTMILMGLSSILLNFYNLTYSSTIGLSYNKGLREYVEIFKIAFFLLMILTLLGIICGGILGTNLKLIRRKNKK